MSQHQQQLEAARTTHKHTCLLLPLCSLCRAHVAKTKVRMRLGVSSTCHAGTNKQHSIARGGGGCGAATRTVTHPPPLSHQHKQATTSLQLLARGRWCGCVKHASPPPSPHTLPTHLVMKQQRSGKGGGGASGMGGEATSSANGCSQSHTASQLHCRACT